MVRGSIYALEELIVFWGNNQFKKVTQTDYNTVNYIKGPMVETSKDFVNKITIA